MFHVKRLFGRVLGFVLDRRLDALYRISYDGRLSAPTRYVCPRCLDDDGRKVRLVSLVLDRKYTCPRCRFTETSSNCKVICGRW